MYQKIYSRKETYKTRFKNSKYIVRIFIKVWLQNNVKKIGKKSKWRHMQIINVVLAKIVFFFRWLSGVDLNSKNMQFACTLR